MSDARRGAIPGREPWVALLAVLLAATPATAQGVRASTRGLLLGANVHGSALKVEEGDHESGGGAGLTAGWGISHQVAIFLHGDLASVDISDPDVEGSYSAGIVDLGVRISFRTPADRFIPHIVAALSAQRATASVLVVPGVSTDIEISGPAFTLGGGFSHFFSPELALDVSLLLTSGRFTEIRIGAVSAEIGELDSQAARFNVGVAWFPVTKR